MENKDQSQQHPAKNQEQENQQEQQQQPEQTVSEEKKEEETPEVTPEVKAEEDQQEPASAEATADKQEQEQEPASAEATADKQEQEAVSEEKKEEDTPEVTPEVKAEEDQQQQQQQQQQQAFSEEKKEEETPEDTPEVKAEEDQQQQQQQPEQAVSEGKKEEEAPEVTPEVKAEEDQQEPASAEATADKQEQVSDTGLSQAEGEVKELSGTDPEQSEGTEQEQQAVAEVKKEEETPKETAEIKAEEEKADTDEDDDEDDEDTTEEDPEETEEKYNKLSREELVASLEEALENEDINKIKRRVSLIRVSFINKSREAKNARFEQFLKDGGQKEAYNDQPDELEQTFSALFTRYKERKKAWIEEQEKIRQENLKAKLQILEDLKELISSEESLKKTYDEFKELQSKWSSTGMVPRTETNNLWQNYHFLVEKFFDKVKINKELRDLDLKKNLEKKLELCEKADELLLENSIDRSFRMLQQFHREWKEIGPVPMDKKDELWERFKHTTDLINQRRRDYYDQRQEELEKNLLAKNALCEQAEELVSADLDSIKAWQEQTDKLNELFKIWKSIGPTPRTDNDKVWQRFRGYMETFYSGKKDYFEKLKDEQLNNYNIKLDLCVQAEGLQNSTDWKSTTRELINLQKRWKEIGPVPRKHSDKIWKRFRAACDTFFNAKDEYFKNIHSHEAENQKKKEELIEQIKTQEYTDDKSSNLEKLKSIQRQWMDIGFVPIKEKDRLQKEFRETIDKKLKELNISSVEMSRVNYREKIDNIKEKQNSGRIISKERNHLQGKIKELQDEINLWENNIGFLANSKKADILKEEFNRKIEKARQDMALLQAKLKMLKDA